MRRPTRPFTVEFKSRRKPAQGVTSDENGGRLIDEPAPDEVPSRDVSEDAPASAGDDTPFAAANRVFSKFTSSAVPTAARLSDLASSAFAPQPTEPSEPSPVAPDNPPQSVRVPPSLSRPVPRRMPGLRTAMCYRLSLRQSNVARLKGARLARYVPLTRTEARPRASVWTLCWTSREAPLNRAPPHRKEIPCRMDVSRTGVGQSLGCLRASVGNGDACQRCAGRQPHYSRIAVTGCHSAAEDPYRRSATKLEE